MRYSSFRASSKESFKGKLNEKLTQTSKNTSYNDTHGSIMAGIGIISNPHSKLNRRNPQRSAYLSYIAGKQGHVAVTHSLDEMEDVARSFRNQEISILAINGGDGTISHTLSVFSRIYPHKELPHIAVLRGGNMNVLAQNLGIKGTPEQVLYRLIEKHSTQPELSYIRKQSLMIDGKVGFLFANGTPAAFLEKFYENKTGALGAAWLISKVVLSRFFWRPFYLSIVSHHDSTIAIDDHIPFRQATISVLISTLPHMPMGPKLFPDMEHVQQGAQFISYSTGPLEASILIPWDAFLRPSKTSRIKTRLVGKTFSIQNDKPVLYTLDGEIYTPKSPQVTIDLGPTFSFVAL